MTSQGTQHSPNIAHCGSVSAQTLGFPDSCAIAQEKSTLPKALFVAKAPISAKTKQHLVHHIDSITMLALARPQNTGIEQGKRIPEILILGLRLHDDVMEIPRDIIELIASQRKSGILFAVVRSVHHEGTTREECALAVRRARATKPGHAPIFEIHAHDWVPAGEATAFFVDDTGMTMDDAWDSLCSQIIFDDDNPHDLDARIAQSERITTLSMQIEKLTRDHQRTKNTAQRNEIYKKLHRAKQELEQISQQ